MLPVKKIARILPLLTIGLMLGACGDSADDVYGLGGVGRAGAAALNRFSGTAAVGAPLTGEVTVKDSLGATRTVAIGTNGSYAVDVLGMTAPFLFRATGTAGGRGYTVHSAATTADLGGTINITQLTDLIVDNIAGQLASDYFDKGIFTALTPVALNAEVAVLKQRLLPVLTALGVDSAVDLLRTPFTPLASALDSALDVLRVSVDPGTNIATITNIVTQQQLADSIITPAGSEGAPPAFTTVSNLATAVADTAAIKAMLNAFAAKFATGLPTAASLLPYFTADYRFEDDDDRNSSSASFATESGWVGMQFTDVSVVRFDYSDPARPVAMIDGSIKDPSGVEVDSFRDFFVRKDTDGVWRLHGDQRVVDMELEAAMFTSMGTGASRCTYTSLEFEVEENLPSNNGGTINHMVVYGPGLPGGSLRWLPPVGSTGEYRTATHGDASLVLAEQCPGGETRVVSDEAIAAIPDNAEYLVVAYSSADDSVRLNFPAPAALTGSGFFVSGGNSVARAGGYLLRLEKRPLTLAEAVASVSSTTGPWPVITAPGGAALTAYNGSSAILNIAGTARPNSVVELGLTGSSATTTFEVETEVKVNSSGAFTGSLSLAGALSAGTHRKLGVLGYDIYHRRFEVELKQAP